MCYPHRLHGRLKLIDLIFSFNIFNHRQWLTMVNSSYLGKSSPFQGFYSCYSCPMANKSPWHDEVLKQWQWSLEVSISQARSSSAALLPRQRWKMWWSLGVNRDRMGKWDGISGICNQPFIHFIFGFARKWDIFADARAARDPQVQRTWYCIFGHIYKKSGYSHQLRKWWDGLLITGFPGDLWDLMNVNTNFGWVNNLLGYKLSQSTLQLWMHTKLIGW